MVIHLKTKNNEQYMLHAFMVKITGQKFMLIHTHTHYNASEQNTF